MLYAHPRCCVNSQASTVSVQTFLPLSFVTFHYSRLLLFFQYNVPVYLTEVQQMHGVFDYDSRLPLAGDALGMEISQPSGCRSG